MKPGAMNGDPRNWQIFQPLDRGRLRVPNRIALMATVNNLGTEHTASPRQVAFYAERARGKVGIIVTEGLSVHPTSVPTPTVPYAYDEALIPDFRKLADAVHAEGSVIYGQLWHVGRNSLWSPFLTPWSASGERDPLSGTTPHAMTDEEIGIVVDSFACSARNLEAAGFDGVELHGGHGYLLTQFLSPWSNKRTDRWGGSVANRSRIIVAIIRAVREVCGPDFVVGFKLSAHEYVEGGLDLPLSQETVRHILGEAPLDYIGVTQANFSPSLERHTPDMRFPDSPFVELAAGIHAVADGTPVMAMAKVPDMAEGERLIQDGTADLIGMSRALLADPHAPRKVLEGRRPRPCVYCNVCWDVVHQLRGIACFYGPELGQEAEGGTRISPVRAEERRVVRVIGGGPAGLEFARVATLRGHEVHLYEALSAVGGRLAREAQLPGRETLAKATTWLEAETRDAGAGIHTGSPIGPEALARFGPDDIVVQATGALPEVEYLPGVERVLSLEDAIARASELEGPIAIVDEIEDEPVYALAELLAEGGREVTIVTRRPQVGRRTPYVNLIGALRRMDALDVRIVAMIVLARVADGALIGRHGLSGRERPIGPIRTLIRAGPYRATAPLGTGGRPGLVVGDAYAPRSVLAVVREANALARDLEQIGKVARRVAART